MCSVPDKVIALFAFQRLNLQLLSEFIPSPDPGGDHLVNLGSTAALASEAGKAYTVERTNSNVTANFIFAEYVKAQKDCCV